MGGGHSIYHIHRYTDYDVEHDLCVFKPYVPYYQRDGGFNYHHEHFHDVKLTNESGTAKEAKGTTQLMRLMQAVDAKRKQG